MKIAIIGYGKMGKAIERIAKERGHEIVCIIDRDDIDLFAGEKFRNADVAIEFSQPAAAVGNILAAFAAGVPVVSGTTGWQENLPELKAMCAKGEGTLMWASNYSIGVNLFMKINEYAASLMQKFPAYKPSLHEVHHIHKLDHPSGTAITLAEEIIAESDTLKGWYEPAEGAVVEIVEAKMPITHTREGEVPGIHSITWESEMDLIKLTHSAKTRDGFALGAVIGAEWLAGKPSGYYTIQEALF